MNNKKICILGFAATMLVGGNAIAAPLLEKVTTPGFVMPEYAITTRCTLNDTGQMTIKYVIGNINSVQTRSIALTKLAIQAAINNAAGHTSWGPVLVADAPVQTYAAYQRQPDGTSKRIVLWQSTGGTNVATNNTSDAVRLRNLIDLNCGDPLQ
jgi:hypothetical protein